MAQVVMRQFGSQEPDQQRVSGHCSDDYRRRAVAHADRIQDIGLLTEDHLGLTDAAPVGLSPSRRREKIPSGPAYMVILNNPWPPEFEKLVEREVSIGGYPPPGIVWGRRRPIRLATTIPVGEQTH